MPKIQENSEYRYPHSKYPIKSILWILYCGVGVFPLNNNKHIKLITITTVIIVNNNKYNNK